MQFLTPTHHHLNYLWLLAILSFSIPAWSVDLAAHVILAKGQVTAVDKNGESRTLKRRSKVFNGDVIKTGANGSVQLRFIDKALMTIKANSEMDIASYQQGGDGKEEKAIMNLVKGGFRTITGQIGKGDKSAYKVTTPAASIGIRGTNYEVQQESDGGFVMAVYSGGISVQNDSGTLDLGLGSDFNFVRVSSSGAAPEGLLSAPESLSENAATEESSEEESKEETAANENEEDATSEEDTTSEDNEEDSENKTLVANDESGDSEGNKSSDESDSENPIEQAITAIQEEMGDLDEGTEEALGEVANALDSQLVEQIEEDSDTLKKQLIDDLVEAGLLQEGQSLSDLEDAVKDNLENLGSLDSLEDALESGTDLTIPDIIPDEDDGTTPTPSTNDFITSLYSDLTAVSNPFNPGLFNNNTVVRDQEYNLIASDKLAVLAMPINYTFGTSGSPEFQLMEAEISSSQTITDFNSYDFTGTGTTIDITYDIIDLSSGTTNTYNISIPVDGNTDVYNLEALLISAVNGSYGVTLETVFGEPEIISSFKIKPVSGSTEFVTKMELQVHSQNEASKNTLYSLLGSSGSNDDWYANVDTEVVIGSGAWKIAAADGSGSPILYFEETEMENGETYTRIEAINKPLNSTDTVGALVSLGICQDDGRICDIAVNTVRASDRIRWGAWLAEPGEGINIYEVKEDSQGFTDGTSHSEEQILAFWLAAERADINQLTGTAQFTSTTNTDCTDFSQCIGFADDGVVQQVTGQFDVDFSSGAITNGNLNINVTDSPNLFTSSLATTTSEWDINFSGQIEAGKPSEFTTNNISGVVKDGAGNQISNQVIGNVGGIFVKPGDTFAGGYNVGAIKNDGSGTKHAAGVFTLDKVSP